MTTNIRMWFLTVLFLKGPKLPQSLLCLCWLLSGMPSSISFLFFRRCCGNRADGLEKSKQGWGLWNMYKRFTEVTASCISFLKAIIACRHASFCLFFQRKKQWTCLWVTVSPGWKIQTLAFSQQMMETNPWGEQVEYAILSKTDLHRLFYFEIT